MQEHVIMLTTLPCGEEMFALEVMASEGPSSASKHRRHLGIEVGRRCVARFRDMKWYFHDDS